MYLKSLELQGFKSFPDRTLIRFSDGMTAIVGPNGSGKSNISDAIRWVLGEQSTKSLRGAKMEDVVFGGTAKRSPMGAARVTLILDNSAGQFPVDATEVMVTRKYFRSGESEYYLNRKRVRLRDVREVFMDTGLGHDGYSIIGQGRIDEILATKSTDRREVFEEAAGVTRFRTRKDEAERKLDQTADNLVRIRDIWSELDARSGPLERQAENAKQYLELRDQLRVHEVSLWMDTLDGMKDMKEKSDRDRLEAQQQLETVRSQQQEQYLCRASGRGNAAVGHAGGAAAGRADPHRGGIQCPVPAHGCIGGNTPQRGRKYRAGKGSAGSPEGAGRRTGAAAAGAQEPSAGTGTGDSAADCCLGNQTEGN